MDDGSNSRKSKASKNDDPRKSKSSSDVRSNMDTPQQPTKRRFKFFSSFRKKTHKRRYDKYRDKNENVDSGLIMSESQPNMLYRSPNSSIDYDEQFSFDSYNQEDISCLRSRSKSHSSNRGSVGIRHMSSEDREHTDLITAGIAVIESDDHHTKEQNVEQTVSNVLSRQHHSVNYNADDAVEDTAMAGEMWIMTRVPDKEASMPPLSQRHTLMRHPFHELEIWLQEGHDLVIRDSCGTSDPYVKFKLGSKQLYKSRTVHKNLNPQWDERFVLSIEDVFRPIQVKVYDYDRGIADDSMGSAELNLTDFILNSPQDVELRLAEKGKESYMGYIKLQATLVPKSQEDKEQYFKRTVKLSDKESAARKLKMQMWTGVVTIILVEGRDLIPMDDNGLSDPYVKFKLGNEKYKSKHKSKTLNPTWLEQFDLRMYQGQTSHLEMMLYDHDVGRDDFMGRAVIDLSKLQKEITHMIEQQLEDGAGLVKLLITISGTSGNETISDLSSFAFSPAEHADIVKQYSRAKSFSNMKDVGWLQVKVYKAQNLLAADLGGKSDPFCVLELVNARLQTHTEYKNLNPEWNKVFTFNVKDIHTVLDVTVYDEDRDKKVEFLGKVAIPLLKIHPRERRWYALKDKKLVHRTKGSILLELELIFNHMKAGVRTVNPKEEKYMQPEPKFKISVMKKNIDRVSQIISTFMDCAKFVRSCFNWESPFRTITAFVVFLVIVWNFELYMLPLTLLVIFLKNVFVTSLTNVYSKDPDENEYNEDDDDFDDDEDRDKEEKKSFKEKLHAAQEICLQVQEGLDVVASLGERVKNTFTWTVPWLSSLAVIALALLASVLYFIPMRYLIMAWGINKFTKKLRAPNAIPNNELLDFLSRVPSDSEQLQYRELRPDINTVPGRKKQKQ